MIAAERIEFDGLLRRASQTRPLPLRVRFAIEATLQNLTLFLCANGPGPALAAACRPDGSFDAIVSTGFCGGTNPSLRVGDIVAATEVRSESGTFAASLPKGPRPALTGVIASQDEVASTTDAKQRLASSGAIAVEMEAAAVAALAEASRTPFYCIRVVSDAAQDDMPLDFNRYRAADGRFDRTAIALAALRRPFTRIPRLRQLKRNCELASERLGAFLADCQF